MSDQDDTLLDEDLGDEEYDLGNDEEEALLADDCDIDRQNSYKGEEETDDVLDLGVTDALDDLDGEEENVEFRNQTDNYNQNHCYNDPNTNCHYNYYEQEEHEQYKEDHTQRFQNNPANLEANVKNPLATGDLREKLQKNVQRIIPKGDKMEDDDPEEATERRNRFQNERTIISPKMNNKIPDSLENVVTAEQVRPAFRGRGRGRASRARGGRFSVQTNYNPRFSGRGPAYEEQNPQFRPLVAETRPPLFPNGPPNMINLPIMYPQGHPVPPPPPPRFQQFSQGPPRPIGQHFNEPGVQVLFNQFPGVAQGSRMSNPRMDFRPRAPGPRFHTPPNQPAFIQSQPPHFQPPRLPHGPEGIMPSNNHEPLISGAQSGSSLLGLGPHLPSGHPPRAQGPPMHSGHPGHPQDRPNGLMPPNYSRPSGPNHGPPMPNHSNAPANTQPNFENRVPFQGPRFEGANMYNVRPPFNNPPTQFNNPVPAGIQPQVPTVSGPPLPQGHKILINPHFRGNPQPPDGRSSWNGTPQIPNEQFAHPSTSYQNQNMYNQPSNNPSINQDYQNNYSQTKNDDPYAYFSDVWQENKTSKPRSLSPSLKSLLGDSNYSRESGYKDYDSKYKSDSRDNYHEDQKYRDRSPPPSRSREYSQKSRSHQSSNSYHNDSYDDYKPSSSSSRSSARTVQKRSPEPVDKSSKDVSPKRSKLGSRNHPDDSTKTASNEHSKNTVEEELDPEMKEYQRKLEEQKRLREKILQEKENRRKQAAMGKQIEDSKDQKVVADTQQNNKLTTSCGNKDATIEKTSQTTTARGKTCSSSALITEDGEKVTRIVRTILTTDKDKKNEELMNNNQLEGQKKSFAQQSSNRRVVIQKPLSNTQRIVTISKTNTNLQKSPSSKSQNSLQNVPNKTTIISKSTANSSSKNVVKEVAKTLRKVIVSNENSTNPKKIISTSQNNQRIVVQNNSKLNTVIVENLAASTTEARIRRMCVGIGKIESITMGDSTATIVFKTHSAAMVFQKKYERKMIDLSMINVRLVSQTNLNQSTNVTIKK
ncbi:RNA-binding protein 33-like [Chelonus insularis]|uniref:RNA-binding protein 33-like n=1 Tax=Chelonus insularis TaxID=460826 RepID=UPI00158C673F|nr:RNA-binding protein 33-like [Chelonus insularis]